MPGQAVPSIGGIVCHPPVHPNTALVYKNHHHLPPARYSMLPIIDRYILWEVIKAFLAIITVLLLILVGSGYMRFLGDVAAGTLGNEVILQLVGIETMRVLGQITPPAFFLAIIVTLGRMYRDSEMTALSASGVGTLRIYRAVLLAALPVTLFVSWLTLDLRPWANAVRLEIGQQQREQVRFGSQVVGRFNEFSRGDLVFYVEGISSDRERLTNVFVQSRQHGRLGLIAAEEGFKQVDPETGEHFVVLSNGRRYEGRPGSNDFSIGDFEKYSLRLNLESRGKRSRNDALGSGELWGAKDLKLRSELQYRLMLPLAVVVFTLISVPLSYSLPRGGVYGRIILAILFYLLFVNLLAISGGWMESGVTPAWLGRWWVHLLMLSLAGGVMFYRSPYLLRRIVTGWRR